VNVRFRRYTVAFVIIVVVALVWTIIPDQRADRPTAFAIADFTPIISETDEQDYIHYLERYAGAARPDRTIRIEGEDYSEASGGLYEVVEQYMGLDGKAVLTPEVGTISWKVRIEEPGLYQIRIHYYPMEGKSSAIERELLINHQVPFKGAELLLFDRVWDNAGEIRRDDRGNDLRPRQVERPRWLLASLSDSDRYIEEPYLFYFDKGEQVISLNSLREPMAIDYIELYQEEPVQTYAQVKAEYDARGLKPTQGHMIIVQGEAAVGKSSPTLYPITDRSSPSVTPYHVSKLRMNAIGGLNWRLPGQWIEWEFEVPEDGLYQIALKRKQDQLRGVYATRSLMIDDRIPFEEMKRIRFNYNAKWQMDVLGGDEPYEFYLTKGKHRLRLTVTLGELAPLMQTVESSVLELNSMYRKILMITSNNPDPMRDYQLDRRIPEMTEVFTRQADIIESVADYLKVVTGEQGDKVAPLKNMVVQLRDMAERPETVARRLNNFKINVGGLGTWLLTVREQPLSLDYLVVYSSDQQLPRAESTLLEDIRHEIGAYLASYTEDYNSIGNVQEKDRSITVWITTGRDQAQVLKGLIDDLFTPETDISVQLKLVPPDILLPATLAGEGPDVAMQMGEDVPVNYAMRGAAYDLTQFPDFDSVAQRFRESALTPYRYAGGVYALPEQQSFPMLFYRKDILEELGLEVPRTWDDVYNMISVLQKHHMDFYLPIDNTLNNGNLVPNATFAMLLFQNDGQFYTDDHKRSALDSETSIEVFRRWTQFYTNYKFPVQVDFPNRFRVGEIPIGIADYTTYNLLTVMAPEIKGLWDFTVVPGTLKEDGTIRHDVASTTTAVVLLEKAKDKDAAWQFLKWWTSKEVQVLFGREMEALMGEAARYPTANIEALEELPWPMKDYRNLNEQWQWVKGIPQVPGGYFTGRHLDNAFRRVINAGENYREALLDYVIYINDEIAIKRKEFNLP